MTSDSLQQNHSPRVLLVDDDKELCALLQEYLSSEDFEVSCVNDGKAAIERITQNEADIDVVVLDIMMPQVSGLDVLREVRKNPNAEFIPIIMLTGKGDDIDRIIGLEMGADDYLGKPCNPRELSARLRAVLRRTQSLKAIPHQDNDPHLKEESICLFGVRVNPANLTVDIEKQGKPLELTGVEFRVLYLLMQNAGTILSKAELTEKALQRKLTAHDRSIDVHISRIRQKLSNEAGLDDVIKAVRGAGYLFVEDV